MNTQVAVELIKAGISGRPVAETRGEWLAHLDAEATLADEGYGPFTSSHEGLGVLLEEVAELQDAIRSNVDVAIACEALQVAAVALRIAEGMGQPATRQRSGCGE